MYSQYENFIKNYDLEKTPFYQFCLHATKEEFLKSQTGFYYAVRAFPQMLCKLASQIESSEERLRVVENIWEEHGNGSIRKFHTQSFITYLKSLGLENKPLAHNYFVDNWIKESLSLDLSAAQYSVYLAGIEYIYAKISHLICKTLENFDLICVQNHYENHANLDIHHAQDLLDVAYQLDSIHHYELFFSSVDKFIELFNQMTFITQAEIDFISQEKIAFYYSREDSEIEISCINNNKPSILTVCSGGEHIINMKNLYPNSTIVALDINSHQLELAQNKISNILEYKNKPVFNNGKFELIFKHFSSKINNEDIKKIQKEDSMAIKKLELLCKDIFSNKNLNNIFTDEATKYSSDDFSLHFFNVFLTKIKDMNEHSSNMSNILGKTLPCEIPSFIDNTNISYYNGDFNDFFKNNELKFDLISLSNIGDWMPQEKYLYLVDTAKLSLNDNGYLIARKLLGDYSLEDVFSNRFDKFYSKNDNTGFYKECMVGIK